MKSRAVRIPAVQVKALLGDLAGEAINISTTGALLKLERAVPVGQPAALVLSKGPDAATLAAEVVRAAPVPETSASGVDACQVGVRFVSVSVEARTAMSRLLAQ